MTTNGKKGATIVGLEARDFQGLKACSIHFVPETGLVKVTGPNGAGKSSTLRAIAAALGGRAEVHERSVNDSSDDGTAEIHVELSDGWRVIRRHTEANPKGALTVVGPDGGRHGQTKLTELLGPISFDPLAFFGLKPERQREILLGLGGDPELAKKLDGLEAEHDALYRERTPAISEQRRARQVPEPEGERPEPVDVSAEMARLGELQAAERELQDAARAVLTAESAETTAQRRVAEQEDEVRRLEAELKAAREALGDRIRERESATAAVREAEATLAELDNPKDEMQEIKDRISAADAVRDALKPWEAWDAAQADLERATTEVARLSGLMDDVKASQRALIAEAGIPVEGLSFDADSGNPLLHGRPLDLASGGERIRLAVQVALATDPHVRVCLIDEANDLDLDALEALNDLAVAEGFQVWVCRIGLEGEGHVAVSAGEARSTAASGSQADLDF